MTVLEAQMRHTDVRTTIAVYSQVIDKTEGEARERVAIGTMVPVRTINHSQHMLIQ